MSIECIKILKFEIDCVEDDIKVCGIVEVGLKDIEFCGDVVVCEMS